MIPRYWPVIDIAAGLAPLRSTGDQAAVSAVARELGVAHCAAVLPVPSAREGLIGYFAELARRDRRRVVVVSAQICPLVPRLLMRLGFAPSFIDVAELMPAAGFDETMRGYEAAGGERDVAAVVVAPMYGHLPAGTDDLAGRLEATSIVVDMAQGVLLAERIPALMHRADAVVYSFGLGKGLDSGGGLLAVRRELGNLRHAGRLAALPWLASVPSVVALRAAVGLGLYGHLLPLLERRLESEKTELPVDDACTVLPRAIFSTWALRLASLRSEISLARCRAAELFSRPAIAERCRDAAIYGASQGVHLRQIIRLHEGNERDGIIASLRRTGVDCAPGGELMPEQYIEAAGGRYPNARQFCSDAIRLPFLGRLSEGDFDRVVSSLEDVLDQRLS